jgi:endonuclease/exonuclease/phosphatase family metal-dependent hydrolase
MSDRPPVIDHETNAVRAKSVAFAIRSIAVWLNLAMGIALIAAHTIQSDWLAPVTMVPPWLWLIPAGILTFIARPILGRSMLAMTILIWLGFVLLYAEEARSLTRFRSLPERHQKDQTTRVATLNCNVGSGKAASELMEYSPDIVLLQESPGPALLPEIANELLGENAEWTTAGDTSILSKGKMLVISADKASHFCHAVVTLADGSQADVVSLRLSPPVFQLDFLSGKFWQKHHETRVKHRAQLQAIVDHLNESAMTQNWIIGGDFNLVGGDGSLSPLKSFKDTFHQSGSGWCNTGTSDYPLFRVDQIWIKGNLRSTINKTFKTEHSDHRMVVTDLLF